MIHDLESADPVELAPPPRKPIDRWLDRAVDLAVTVGLSILWGVTIVFGALILLDDGDGWRFQEAVAVGATTICVPAWLLHGWARRAGRRPRG